MKALSKNPKGFGAVELLIILVFLGLVGFAGWRVYNKLSDSILGTGGSSANAKPGALMYSYFDGSRKKVNSFDLDTGQKKPVLQQGASGSARGGSSITLDAFISSDKQMVAYRFGYGDKVEVIRSDGQKVREVPRNDVYSFAWIKGGHKLLLQKSNSKNCTGINCEAPIYGWGSDWYVYDVDSGKETKLNVGDNNFNGFEGQSAGTLYFTTNSPYGVTPKLYAYDIDSHKAGEVGNFPKQDGIQLSFISTSPGNRHTIISILPQGYGVNYRCTIYELKGDKLGDKLIDDADYQCKNAYWVNDDEFYFDKSTGPSGQIITSDTSPSGYYILFSVHKYSFKDKRQNKVLLGDGKRVYLLMGALPDGSFVVSDSSGSSLHPSYKLEIRNPDGSHKTSIASGSKPLTLIGPVR